jgi:broad specificity phosphatase PhoE
MYLILVRHGNTFEAGQKAVWVGGRTDVSLVSKGRQQAIAVGEALKKTGVNARRIIAGPLKRTRETAALIAHEIGVPVASIAIDERLREIDYGLWEGKSSEEIRAIGGGAELRAWEEDARWPAAAGWSSAYGEQVHALSALVDDVRRAADDFVVIVSSNGIFRLLSTWIDPDRTDTKMATGHLSILRISSAKVDISSWNLPPSALDDVRSIFLRDGP